MSATLPTQVSEMLAVEKELGRDPSADFGRRINQLKYAIWQGDTEGATKLSHEAEGLGNVILSGEDAEKIGYYFKEIRKNIEERDYESCKAGCRLPLEDIKNLMMRAGCPMTRVL